MAVAGALAACLTGPGGEASAAVPVLLQPRDDPGRALEAVDPVRRQARVLSRARTFGARIAGNARGDAVAAWLQGDEDDDGSSLRMATRDGRTGRWRRSRPLGPRGGSYEVAVAMDGRGRALVAWFEANSVHGAVVAAGGAPGSRITLAPPGSGNAYSLGAAVGPSGATVLWRSSRSGPPQTDEIVAQDLGPHGITGPLVVLGPGSAPVLAGSDRGGLIAAWTSAEGVKVARRAAGAWGTPAVLDAAPGEVLAAAVGPAGHAALAYRDEQAALRLGRAGPGAGFAAPAVHSVPPGSRPVRRQVAVAVDGRGATAMVRQLPGGTLLGHVLHADEAGPGRQIVVRRGTRRTDLAAGDPSLLPRTSGFRVAWQVGDRRLVGLRTRVLGESRVRTLAQRPLVVRQRPARTCRPPGSRVLRRSADAVVALISYPSGFEGYHACLFASGLPAEIPFEATPPTIALAGSFAAWPVTECTANDCVSDVRVVNLRDPRERRSRSVRLDPRGVARMAIRRDGTAAVLACTGFDVAVGEGGCSGASSSPRELLLITPYGSPRVIARSHRIPRDSLRFTNRGLHWRQDGRDRAVRSR